MSVREPGAVMKRIVSKVAVTALLVLLSGCTDKAQPSFDTCVQADTAGDLAAAVTACTNAIVTDPNSKSGKAATEKIVSLKERIAAKEKADAEAKAKLVGACKSGDTGACGAACDAGDPTSCVTLGLVDLASEDDAVQAKAEGPLTKACNGGAGKACYELARKLSEIRAAALTPSAAMKLAMDKAATHEIGLEEASFATKGCDVNYGAACAEIAARYIDGSPVQKDAVKGKQLGEKAVKLLPADCEAGDGRSCTVLGTLYVGRYGARYGLPKDATKGLAFFKKGCAAKDEDACKLVTNFDSLVALKPSGPMHAAHVLVQWAGSTSSKQRRSKADALARAQEAKAKLDAGEDFAAVALAYDDDGARTRGGDLGTFQPGTFPKPFESAVAGLDVGGVSDIVETSFGYHIIKRLPAAEKSTVTGVHATAKLNGQVIDSMRFQCPPGTSPMSMGMFCSCGGGVTFEAVCDTHGWRAWQDDDSCVFPCPAFVAHHEVATKCPVGRVAEGYAHGCMCVDPQKPEEPGPPHEAPRPPRKCDEIPRADGASCVWSCE